MNKVDRGIITGMVFGDGCLRVRDRIKDGKYSYVQSELRIKHSYKQRAYLEYKAELIRKIFGGNATVKDTTVVINGETHNQVLFSKSNNYFKTLKSVIYPNGVKTFTKQSLSYLTPHGIAIWYMDDGSAHVNYNKEGWVSSCFTCIATCCSLPEVELIVDYFDSNHGIKVKKMYDKKGHWSLRINTESSQLFARLISPFVIPEMRYKLAHVANLNVQECKTHSSLCVQCGVNSYGNQRRAGLCGKCYTNNNYAKQKANKCEDIVRTNANKEALEVTDKEL
jgi:hypothetical protein